MVSRTRTMLPATTLPAARPVAGSRYSRSSSKPSLTGRLVLPVAQVAQPGGVVHRPGGGLDGQRRGRLSHRTQRQPQLAHAGAPAGAQGPVVQALLPDGHPGRGGGRRSALRIVGQGHQGVEVLLGAAPGPRLAPAPGPRRATPG